MHWLTDSLHTACVLLLVVTCAFFYSLGKIEGTTQGRADRDRELDIQNRQFFEVHFGRPHD
jgi:hypothetical protein